MPGWWKVGRAVARFQKVANKSLLTVKTQPIPQRDTNIEHQEIEQKIILSSSTSPASAKGTNFENKEFSETSPLIGEFSETSPLIGEFSETSPLIGVHLSDSNWEEEEDEERPCSDRIKVPVPQSLIEFVGLDGLSPGAREIRNVDKLLQEQHSLKCHGEDQDLEFESDMGKEGIENEDPIKVSIENQLGHIEGDSENSRIFPIKVLPKTLDNSEDWDMSSSNSEETVETSETVHESSFDLLSKVETFLGDSLSDIEEDSLELRQGVVNESDFEELGTMPKQNFFNESDLIKPVHEEVDYSYPVIDKSLKSGYLREPDFQEVITETKQEAFQELGLSKNAEIRVVSLFDVLLITGMIIISMHRIALVDQVVNFFEFLEEALNCLIFARCFDFLRQL